MLVVLICYTGFLSGCAKREGLQGISDYTFTNSNSVSVTLDLYNSMDDYNNNQNRIAQYHLDPGEKLTLPLEMLHTYGLDWYSANYTYSNWVEKNHSGGGPYANISTLPEIKVAAEDDHYTLYVDRWDTSRSVLLNNTGIFSTWQTTVTGLPRFNGTHNFRLSKDFKCVYTYTDESGKVTTRNITYGIHNELAPQFSILLENKPGDPFMELYFSSFTDYPPMNRDTLLADFYDSSIHRTLYPTVRL